MAMCKKMATAGAVAAMGLGLGAASASAYAVSGGSYTGAATGNHSFTIAGAYTFTCPAVGVRFAGTATGSATTSFAPGFGVNCSFFGLPAQSTQVGPWSITVTSGPDGAGWYGADLHIPTGSSITLEVPLAGCTVAIAGTQGFANGVGSNVVRAKNTTPTGVQLEIAIENIAFSATGCPFSSAIGGTFTGTVDIPGITVS